METESIVETTEAEGTTQEDVTPEDISDIDALTDEQINQLLAGEAIVEDATEETPEPEGEAKSAQEEEAPATEAAAQTDSDKPALESERIKQLEERLAQQERYIKARNQEIGILRKQKREENQQLESKLSDEEYLADPKSVIDARLKMRENEKELADLDQEEAASVAILNNQKIVHKHIPPEDFDIEGMVRVLEQDGVHPDGIKAFAENPMMENPIVVINLWKRAKLQKQFLQLAGITKKLLQEKEALEKKPREVLQTVARNLKRPASVSVTTGGSSKAKTLSLTDSQISNLSDAEIDAYLKESA